MDFSGYPITTSTPITYDLVIKLWQAWWRRHIAMGHLYWPFPDAAFPGGTDSGIVTSTSIDTTNNRITATCQMESSWGVSTLSGACTGKRWSNYVCTLCELSPMPSSYDLIVMVDFYEPRSHIRMHIVDQVDPTEEGGTGQLIVDMTAAQNAVTAGYIDSLSSLDGKEYYIQKAGGAWITDRWPSRPDDQQQWIGNGSGTTGYWPADDSTDEITGVVTHNGPQYVLLEDSNTNTVWGEDQWVGFELMVFSGAFLRRLTIVHNDDRTIYVEKNDDSTGITGQFSIVDVGNKCTPGRPVWNYQQWMAGAADVAAGHLADDSLGTVAVPKGSIEYLSGNPCGGGDCYPPRHEHLFDTRGNQIDYQIGYDDICAGSSAGNYVNRNCWLSLRMLQQDIEASCVSFLPILGEGATDEGKTAINTYTPAVLFRDLGSPSGSTTTSFNTTSTVDNGDGTTREYGDYYFMVSGEFIGQDVRYTIFDKDGKVQTYGIASSDETGKISGILDAQYGKDPKNVGLQIVYALPWLRVRPRWVRYLYGHTGFIPAVGSTTIGGEPQVIDPPITVPNDDGTIDCSLVGKWIMQGASTAAVVIGQGQVYDAEELIVGELYRVIGDNYRDPFPGGATTGTGALLNPYHDKFYRGKLSNPNQTARDISKAGKVSEGDYRSLKQTTHNWQALWGNTGGNMRVEQLVASAGSGASVFKDSTKNVENNHLPHGCFWKNDGDPRYPGFSSPYAGFIIEIDKVRTLPDPDPSVLAVNPQAVVTSTVTFKAVITSTTASAAGVEVHFEPFQIRKYTASNQSWTWESFVIQPGDVGRIPEPAYELSTWKDREVKVIRDNGTTFTVKILANDGSTLFFAPQSQPIAEGDQWEIIEKGPGVYRWTGSEFVVATGADAARLTVQTPSDFLPDPNANNNGWVKDYGLIDYGDLAHIGILNQLHAAIVLLYDTKGPLQWTNKSSDTAEPEKNGRDARASLPWWTESAELYAYYQDYVNEYNAGNDPDISITDVCYPNHDDAWKRCWKAIFDIHDTYHSISELEYGDILAGGDGTSFFDYTPPQQAGRFEDAYDYKSKYEYPYVYCGGEPNCAFGMATDGGAVLYSFLAMKAVESYGYVAPQAGFKKLSASISGVVHAVIAPEDPEEGYFFPYGADFCTSYRVGSTKNKFEAAGSGAIWRKWHVYSSWSAPVGTKTNVYGPKYGSKNFLGDPSPTKLPCLDVTCSYDYGDGPVSYRPCQEHDDYGQMGWIVNDQFSRIHWNMEGY